MTKIFIGSTSKDLEDYRKAAIDTCLALDFQPIAMEHFPAMGVGATEGSKRKVDEADLYVGIFAHRYGYIEDGYNKSVTEIEFDYAGERKLDRLCFLVAPSHPWPRDGDDEDPGYTEKLRAFKQRIDSTLIRAQFTTVDDFRARLTQALVEWRKTQAAPITYTVSGVFARTPGEIPEQPRVLFGRDELQTNVETLLRQRERVLLQGFGGMGKTALAATIAANWVTEHGPVLWIRAGQAPAEALLEGLARPFGAEKAMAAAQGEEAKTDVLRQILAGSGAALLVIDDAWEGAALAPVLKAVPATLPLLVTSRHRLPLGKRRDVGQLDPIPALQLLGHHADHDLSGDDAAQTLCQHLGYHAYALEVAGRTLNVDEVTPADLLRRVENAPHNLHVPEDLALEGRRSIADLIEISMEALRGKGDEGRMACEIFLAFGAFFTPSATPELLALFFRGTPEISDELLVEIRRDNPRLDDISDDELRTLVEQHILNDLDSSPVEEALRMLARRGLVELVPQTDNTAAHYRLHDLAYSYARAQHTDDTRHRAVDACLRYIQKYNTPSLANFAALRPEVENFMGAAAWAFAHERYADVEAFAWNLYRGSEFFALQGYYTQAIRLLESAARAAARQGDRQAEGAHLGNLGLAYASLGQVQQAIDYYQQALAIAREIGDRRGEGNRLGNLGLAYADLGQVQQAIDYYQQALAIRHEIGDRRGEGNDLGNLGNAYYSLGQVQQAIDYYQQALNISREIGDRRGEGSDLGNLGNAYADLGQYQQSIDYYQQALAIHHEIGDRHGEGNNLNNIGAAYEAQSDYTQALIYYGQARAVFAAIGLPHRVEQVDHNIAEAQAGLAGGAADMV